MNAITTTIFHLEHQSIRRYPGNYEQFKRSYELNKEQLQAAYTRQQREIERLEDFIQKNRIRKAKQAKSREKMLERMERIDRPSSGRSLASPSGCMPIRRARSSKQDYFRSGIASRYSLRSI